MKIKAEIAADERRISELREQRRCEQMDSLLRLVTERQQSDSEIAMKTLRLAEASAIERKIEADKFENRLYRANLLMKQYLTAMPQTATEILLWIKEIDDLFLRNSIDEDLRIPILVPYLNHDVKRLMKCLSNDEINSYDSLKARILVEYRVTATNFKQF